MGRAQEAIGSLARVVTVTVALAALTCLLPAVASAASGTCPGAQIPTADGCTAFADARQGVESIISQSFQENDLRAALVRIDVAGRTLTKAAEGQSTAGVAANQRMHFRIGSIAIPFLIDVLFQLEDEGRLSLDDPISEWFPNYPNADQITLRMLASATSGYPDWIQENPAFINALYANPFRQWKSKELLHIALNRPLICAPAQCFHYAHTGFIIISRVIHRVTGKPTGHLMRKRVLQPLGLDQTNISALPGMPPPVLHAYTADRGPYEDSTGWSPSWGIGKSTLMSSTTADLIDAARAFGEGTLVSRRAARERISPDLTADLPPFAEVGGLYYYGIGSLIYNTWEFQNPQQNGYTAIMAYLPSRDISLAVVATKGISAAQTPTNFSERLWSQITAYLTPEHEVNLSP